MKVVLCNYSKNNMDVTMNEIDDSDQWRFIGFYGNSFAST